MANIVNAGYVFKDDGTVVSGASVSVLQADTSTSVATGTTNSSGYYSITTTTENANAYDVKIESGASVRYRRGKDRVQMMELDIRNNTANTQGGLLVANNTNNASNKIATFANRSRTGADNDEIYVSFEMMNDADEIHEFARITAEQNDASNGNEDGELRFGVSVAGSIVDVFTINASTAGVSDMTLDVSGDLTLDADGGDVFFKDGGTTFGSATNNSGNLIIKSGTTTALTFTGSSVAIAGDLTITGDDLVMGTNTSGHVLVADGTNYNPVAVSGDVTMASNGAVTIANDAVTSAKIADDAISSALIADGAVTTALIGADAITGAKIADDAIDSEHYTDASVDFAHIQNVAANSILGRDANSSGVLSEVALATTQILIGDGTGFTAAALSGDVTMTNAGVVTIASSAVETAMINADAVTNAKIADDAINSEHYTDGSIDTAHIADNNVTAAKIFDLARGSILYGNASAATAELTKGSANTVLTSDGTDISWAAASSGVSLGKALAFSIIF